MPEEITNLRFDNRFAELGEGFFNRLEPTSFTNPVLAAFNPDAAKLIGLGPDSSQESGFVDYFCGNRRIPGADYLASVYSGHQFGHYVPQLGDGRAILIGEVNGWEIQLKGSGKTPYSRFGDGRAVLRSTIREYLCSEAMHNLGIPTTRALCIIASDEDVRREAVEKAAMLTRLAPSHVRFGHFEYFYYTNQHERLRELVDFIITNFYPGLDYAEFFNEVALRTARLIAKWQAAGFAHGVMNTDNMSILGITIDYGPFGFLDAYEPGFICNHSDTSGRYAFDRQPGIGLWNLYALAQALEPLIPQEKTAEALKKYYPELAEEYLRLMRLKLGLTSQMEGDENLIRDLLDLLAENRVDYTNFFRSLGSQADLRDRFLNREAYDKWFSDYRKRLEKQSVGESDVRVIMNSANPKYTLRNYLAETAIQKAVMEHDYSEIAKLLEILKKPFDEQPEMAEYAKEPPEWGRALEISCSS